MEIREARKDDWLAVAALLAELGRPDVLAEADADMHRGAWEEYLERPDTVALVAEEEGAVVGFVDLEYRERLNFSAPQAWIPDLVVTVDPQDVRYHFAGCDLSGTCLVNAATANATNSCTW